MSVRRSVRPSVGRSVGPSVTHELKSREIDYLKHKLDIVASKHDYIYHWTHLKPVISFISYIINENPPKIDVFDGPLIHDGPLPGASK